MITALSVAKIRCRWLFNLTSHRKKSSGIKSRFKSNSTVVGSWGRRRCCVRLVKCESTSGSNPAHGTGHFHAGRWSVPPRQSLGWSEHVRNGSRLDVNARLCNLVNSRKRRIYVLVCTTREGVANLHDRRTATESWTWTAAPVELLSTSLINLVAEPLLSTRTSFPRCEPFSITRNSESYMHKVIMSHETCSLDWTAYRPNLRGLCEPSSPNFATCSVVTVMYKIESQIWGVPRPKNLLSAQHFHTMFRLWERVDFKFREWSGQK